MIQQLHISNYALLKEVDISFNDGFTVVSGETGAGKSIILDALSLLFGKRVERSVVANDEKKTIVEGVFKLNDSHKFFFEIHNLDFDYETVIRRELRANGKSRAFINDSPVLLNVLSNFSQIIVEFFAQNQTVMFKEDESKFNFLDQFSDSNNLLNEYRDCFYEFNKLNQDLNKLKNQGSLSAAEIDFLKFQYSEIDRANLVLGEKEQLEKNIIILENFNNIHSAICDSQDILNLEEGIVKQLSIIRNKLSGVNTFSEIDKRIESIIIDLNDINLEFSNISNKFSDYKSEDLNDINTRLDVINSLLQKHRMKFVQQLLDLKDDLRSRIDLADSFEILLEEKQKQIDNKEKNLRTLAYSLNKRRLSVVPLIKEEIEKVLHNIGMPYSRFNIDILDDVKFHNYGIGLISFKFSANKGLDMQELYKVASGGELSRLLLAIKYVTARRFSVSTLIFDEIDSGVSGEIASLMGDMMKYISKSSQLISISHLPQIAAKADTHLKVIKNITKKATYTTVMELDQESRVSEIAKLLSGRKITKAAISNAIELLNQ